MFAAATRSFPVTEEPTATSLIPSAWKQIIEPANPFLAAVSQGLAEQVATFDLEIAPYAEYALTNQGKHLRPALVCLSGQAVGEVGKPLVDAAVIIEMIHLATLVHDDIMDEATVRRKKPTLAANWGNEISVLLGDCLFAHALKLAAAFPTTEVCRAVASATKTVCSGEILQTHRRSNFNFTQPDYFKVIGMKTAELFSLSCELGSSLAGATPAEKAALKHYGFSLGTAYQIHDDCLDLFGTELAVGKSLGTDIARGKLTLPVLIALEKSTAAERAVAESWITDWEPSQHIPLLLSWLENHQALAATQEQLRGYLNRARMALESVESSSSREALLQLADYIDHQNRALSPR